jgi:hypothetical protein
MSPSDFQPDPHATRRFLDRRTFLGTTAGGLSSIALTSLLNEQKLLAADAPAIDPADPHASRMGHRPAMA